MSVNRKFTKVFVLLSGGLDSSVALAYAKSQHPGAHFEAVTIDYGQRHIKEAESAKTIAEHFKATHYVVDAKGFMRGMLTDPDEAIPNASYDELPHGISPTYVSFRNGLMLSILAARAQAWIMDAEKYEERTREELKLSPNAPRNEFEAVIYCGVHADDGANWAYPDCTPEFIGGMANAIYIGTYHKVRLVAPFVNMPKHLIVTIGAMANVPLEKTWSCYAGGEKHCGTCPTCRSRKDAFKLAKRQDLTEYDH
jgi:7-cyano-7-deazaguanine synthase